MKKIVLIAAAGLLVTANAAMAKSIVGSDHDLTTGDAKSELCVYCHTPHNAAIAVPLWNRNNPSATNFKLYNSSTLSSSAKKSALDANSISLFCMSCHDGQTGLGNVVVNRAASNTLRGPIEAIDPLQNTNLGTDLRNTHPIGFNFFEAQSEDNGLRTDAQIKARFESGKAPDATAVQEFLYGSNNSMFECASCHRVHDPGTSGNFLRIENTKSALCLACHNK
ncbi:cytochrome c3 family protein [Geobacter sp. DSM 9736]|uniref:cytochrome c3 family protein n=1 Tax=Geobacter sp. DSM 9736 TaxID=1277350 RepID=UPI000B501BB7|nr:cytochrome c3 family protein [Geobacter sp. DSM 9736]SNB46641.1 doubled CXXCH domain-containing protein [Geobacter sp. DSM 9736]